MKDKCFITFTSPVDRSMIPDQLNDPFGTTIPEICKIAATELQQYMLTHQPSWQHNFGLDQNKIGPVKGKMFGVLVVENVAKEIGYLCTFSGKFNDEPYPSLFVPSLFDISTNDYFITKGMTTLSQMGENIHLLEAEKNVNLLPTIEQLKIDRKKKSIALQQELFDQYQFLNTEGELKSLCAIFESYTKRKPVSGAGECAAPKLFQYAFERKMKPLAIAEFWWGKSTKSEDKVHGNFYPACHEKCRPILSYMLGL